MAEYVIEMRQITKAFGNVVANDHIDLKVKKGTIHALLGENGSGKSTLMNILFGLHQSDSGEILLDGEPTIINSPLDAIRKGIGMIHQEFMLLPNLTVRENLMVGILEKDPKAKMKNLLKEEDEIAARFDLQDKMELPVKELSVGEQQKVEIAKTLYQGAEIIVLDEPTSVLTPQEGLQLFEVLKALKKEGKTILLITHKLDEVLNYSQDVTVLRAGKKVDAFETAETDRYSLAERMVGRKVLFKLKEKKAVSEETAVRVKDITLHDRTGLLKLDHISFDIKKGEILGIAGVDGNGQSELSEVLAGVRKPEQGSYYIGEEQITVYHPMKLAEKNVSFVPGERKDYGSVINLSIEENLILKNFRKKAFNRRGILNKTAIQKHAETLIQDYGIKVENSKSQVKSLSGGNMQKVILARELSSNPKFLICVQPTRGLDIGAVEYVQNLLIEARNKGISILLISTDLDEILALSDRIAVISRGKIVDIMENTQDLDIGLIGLMMAGGENPNQFVIRGEAI